MAEPLYRCGEYVETPEGVARVERHEGGVVTVRFAAGTEATYPDTSVSDLRVASDWYPELGTVLIDSPDHPHSLRVSAARKVASQGYEDGYQQALADAGRELASHDPDYRAAFHKGWVDGLAAREDHPDPARQTETLDAGPPSDLGDPQAPLFVSTAAGLWDFLRGDQTPTETWAGPGHNPSFDACAWRRNSRCWYPKDLNRELTDQKGIMVWNGSDRGYCPRILWDEQRACRLFSAGPYDGGSPAPMASDYIYGDRLA